MTQTLDGQRWRVTDVASVTDGDTVRLFRERTETIDDEFDMVIFTSPRRHPRGVPIRLVWVDTPEKGDEPGWTLARRDTAAWLAQHKLTGLLEVITYGGAGFDRILGDIGYIDPSTAQWCSLSQWLMRERGWPPYVRGA